MTTTGGGRSLSDSARPRPWSRGFRLAARSRLDARRLARVRGGRRRVRRPRRLLHPDELRLRHRRLRVVVVTDRGAERGGDRARGTRATTCPTTCARCRPSASRTSARPRRWPTLPSTTWRSAPSIAADAVTPDLDDTNLGRGLLASSRHEFSDRPRPRRAGPRTQPRQPRRARGDRRRPGGARALRRRVGDAPGALRPSPRPARLRRASPTSGSSTATPSARDARCAQPTPPPTGSPSTAPPSPRCSATSSSAAATSAPRDARVREGAAPRSPSSCSRRSVRHASTWPRRPARRRHRPPPRPHPAPSRHERGRAARRPAGASRSAGRRDPIVRPRAHDRHAAAVVGSGHRSRDGDLRGRPRRRRRLRRPCRRARAARVRRPARQRLRQRRARVVAVPSGDIAGALPYVDHALRLGTPDALLHFHAAVVFDAAGQADRARDEIGTRARRQPVVLRPLPRPGPGPRAEARGDAMRRTAVRRVLVVLGGAVAAVLLTPALASAHPLGNFTVNSYAGLAGRGRPRRRRLRRRHGGDPDVPSSARHRPQRRRRHRPCRSGAVRADALLRDDEGPARSWSTMRRRCCIPVRARPRFPPVRRGWRRCGSSASTTPR